MASLPLTPTPNPHTSPINSTKTSKSPKSAPISPNGTHEEFKDHQLLYKAYYHDISSLCKDGKIKESVTLLAEMEYNNLQIGPEIYGELLQACVSERALITGQQVHARILKNGDFFSRNVYIETKLLIFYAKCDDSDVANRLFRRLRKQNVFAWAALIGLNCRLGFTEEALSGYCKMLENGYLPDNFVIPNALKACGALQVINYGKGIHGYVIKMGFEDCVFVSSSLIDMYGKCGVLEHSRKVFDYIPERNVVTWNSIIASYVQNGMNKEAIEVFYNMRTEGIEPTRVTIASFLSASANLLAISEGKQGQAIAVLIGLDLDNILGSSLLNFYSKIGLINEADLVFSKMIEKDEVAWNLLITSYIQHGQIESALKACHLMSLANLRFDSVTLSSILSISAITSNMKLGKEGHCYCIRKNLESDIAVTSSIIDMYAKCERIDYARRVFDFTTKRDLTIWNKLLAAYAEMGMSGEALKLFYHMQLDSVPPNLISWHSIILGFLRNGQINEAKDMFSQMKSLGFQPNFITYTTMISGLAENGYGYESILLFKQMQEENIQPNGEIIMGLLSAARNIPSLKYERAIHGYITRHGFHMSDEILKCLFDMYARSGDIS